MKDTIYTSHSKLARTVDRLFNERKKQYPVYTGKGLSTWTPENKVKKSFKYQPKRIENQSNGLTDRIREQRREMNRAYFATLKEGRSWT